MRSGFCGFHRHAHQRGIPRWHPCGGVEEQIRTRRTSKSPRAPYFFIQVFLIKLEAYWWNTDFSASRKEVIIISTQSAERLVKQTPSTEHFRAGIVVGNVMAANCRWATSAPALFTCVCCISEFFILLMQCSPQQNRAMRATCCFTPLFNSHFYVFFLLLSEFICPRYINIVVLHTKQLFRLTQA